MTYFKKYNLIVGWLAFAIATVAYIMTMEPTASLWDCAEFIATAYKLEVGHPPGSPLFMMIARIFAVFAPTPDKAAMMINAMSSVASGFTVLFLFWSITHLAAKLYAKDRKDLTKTQIWTVMGAGFIGSMTYAFLDTIWFSAVESEVYALSSLFTAVVFWAILMWENVADKPHSKRWLILIAYLMGLSMGVHILNLLTIPAIVFVYYFKTTPQVSVWGVVKATIVSVAILLGIYAIIIPYSVSIGAWFDKLFVNSFSLPVNSGMLFFVFAVFALAAWGIYKTHQKGKVLANTVILCTTVILLGYGSYASVTIRASVNPPMNSNNPSNPYSLLSLLNRDQYGNRPLLYGPYYSSPAIDNTFSTRNFLDVDGKYKSYQAPTGLVYADGFETVFPRMWREERSQDYQSWIDVKGKQIPFNDNMITVPTGGENIEFLFKYQLNYMFWRYFLWNFAGRQNDNQGFGDLVNGNWISGIKPIDAIYLGPQDNLPSEMADNKARNRYFFLPFILGLIGLIYQLNRDKKDFTVVMWMFVMMGIALVFYFNTAPAEPRERDYVYAGAFYAFCIWIGMGVMWLRDIINKISKRDTMVAAAGSVVLCSAVPVIVCQQNWDDHDRSHRYVASDIGFNYLESTLPNSIIMNFGDNDTFPLWYNQEVEGVRTDVKIMNLSYLGGDWYIDQMRVKSNEADPVPFSLPRSKYIANNNDRLAVDNIVSKPIDIRTAMQWVANDDPRTQGATQSGKMIDFLPATKLILPVNKQNAIDCGIVDEKDAHLMLDSIIIDIGNQTSIMKNDMMVLDLLANFDWSRPLYFTSPYLPSKFGLQSYLQFDGYAYRLVPIYTPVQGSIGRIDTEYLYPLLMDKFRFGNVEDLRVNADYFTRFNLGDATKSRSAFARLSIALSAEGDRERAVEVMDRGIKKLPFSQIGHSDSQTTPVIQAYYIAQQWDKGNAVLEDYVRVLKEYVTYFARFKGQKANSIAYEFYDKINMLEKLYNLSGVFGQSEQSDDIKSFLASYGIDI